MENESKSECPLCKWFSSLIKSNICKKLSGDKKEKCIKIIEKIDKQKIDFDNAIDYLVKNFKIKREELKELASKKFDSDYGRKNKENKG